MSKRRTIGIDLGTTTTVMAFHDGERCDILAAPSGRELMPSIVAVQEDGEIIVGERAAKRLLNDENPRYVYSNFKRHIGVPFNENEDHGFQLTADENGDAAYIGPNNRLYSPVELSAETLKVMKAEAERRLGGPVDGAVIAVPAYFKQPRKTATIEAGRLAGFKNVSLISEPEAGAIAHGLDKRKYARVAVFDLGGGTFDFVVMDVAKGVFTELDKNGSEYLGGVDWDKRIQDLVVERYPDIKKLKFSMMKLAPEAQAAKEELTEEDTVAVAIQNGTWDEAANRLSDARVELSRDKFNEMTRDLVDRAMEIVDQTLKRIDCEAWKIDEVVLVGGMTRVPAVRQAVAEFFPKAKLLERTSADKAVAIGAAIKAAELDKRLVRRIHHESVAAQPIGIAGVNDEFIPIIESGCPYDELRSLPVTNAENGQTRIPIAIVEGDSDKASENTRIAFYPLDIEKSDTRTAKVTIDLMLDANGMLKMGGRDELAGTSFEAKGQV